MKAPLEWRQIEALLEGEGLESPARVLLIASPSAVRVPKGNAVQQAGPIGAAEVRVADAAESAVVVEPESWLGRDAAVHLLARLRDLGYRRIHLVTRGDCWRDEELRALGYLPLEPRGMPRVWLHDPDIFYTPREWNTPEGWAHPQNFRRRRW